MCISVSSGLFLDLFYLYAYNSYNVCSNKSFVRLNAPGKVWELFVFLTVMTLQSLLVLLMQLLGVL